MSMYLSFFTLAGCKISVVLTWLANMRIYNKSSEVHHVNFYILNLQVKYNSLVQSNVKKS